MRVSLAFIGVWLVFDRTATWLGSGRGEWGWLICALVLGLLLPIERALDRQTWLGAVRALGLGQSKLAPMAVATSFPLAWLYERAGFSIWPAAVLHAAIQAPIKLVVVEANAFSSMAVAWMAVAASLPWSVFFLREEPQARLSASLQHS